VVNQSTIVFFFLLAAFLIYITQRGELDAYLALLFSGTGGTSPATAPSTTSAAQNVAQTFSAAGNTVPSWLTTAAAIGAP